MATVTVNSLNNYKGTNLEKAFATQKSELSLEMIKSRLSDNLSKGKITEEEHDNALAIAEAAHVKK